MLDTVPPDDPWETAPQPPDPELISTSERLMAKSNPVASSEIVENSEDEQVQKIQQLEAEKQQLLKRNINLRVEIAHLQSTNQQLLQQIAQLKQRSQTPWWKRLWGR